MCWAVKDIIRGPIGAAFEFIDLTWTEFSAACLALLIDQGDEFAHGDFNCCSEILKFRMLSLDFFLVFLYTPCCNGTTFLSYCQVKN